MFKLQSRSMDLSKKKPSNQNTFIQMEEVMKRFLVRELKKLLIKKVVGLLLLMIFYQKLKKINIYLMVILILIMLIDILV